MSAADLRESVVKAILDTQILTLAQIGSPVGIKEGAAARALASAALRAIADAGFVIVPKDPTSAAISAGTKAIMDTIEYENSDGRDIILNPREVARAALAAAFKTMGR